MNRVLGLLILFSSVVSYASEIEDQWFEANRAGDLKKVEFILSHRPQLLNLKNDKGHTALILASYHQHRTLTLELMKKGADPCTSDKKGNSALMGVIFKGHEEIIYDLMDKCDVNHKNHEGQTALMYASLFGREKVAKDLLKRGADKDLVDHEGRNATSIAQGQWNKTMVSLLKTFRVIK